MATNNYFPTYFQEYIHLSRYSRWLPDKNRRETWAETVDRYFNFFDEHLKENHNHDISSYRQEIQDAVLSLKVMPSMRCLMTAGEALRRENSAGFNCSFIAIDNPKAFDEILYVLMNGVGAGFSVESKFTEQLPVVAESFHDSETVIVVADSKLGWAKALRELIHLLYSGQIPQWDVSKVRPAGMPLKTFGGRASGPGPLVELFKFCVATFKKAAGRRLTTLECHDIVTKTAEIVVVGGVRRSALISLSDLSDDRLRHAKSGQWWIENVQRALANNSATYKEKPDIGIFMDEWKALYDSKSGERGIFNRESAKKNMEKYGRRDSDYDFGVNPCVVGSTKVRTSAGVMTMQELAEMSNATELLVESYNIHTKKVETQPIMFAGLTKENANVIELEIEDTLGTVHKITLTPDHQVYTENRGYVKAADLEETDELVVIATTKTIKGRVVRKNVKENENVYDLKVLNNHNFFADDVLIHNCGEILLRSSQYCVTGSTPLITKTGIFDIETLQDKECEVWNGLRWSKVIVRKTRENQKIVRVHLSDGSFLDCTPDHKFSVRHRFEKEYRQVEAQHLCDEDYVLHCEPFTISDRLEGESLNDAYTLGFAVGDGCVYNNKVSIDLYNQKILCPVSGKRREKKKKDGYNYESQNVSTDLDPLLVSSLKNDPDAIRSLTKYKRDDFIDFLSGLADSDGAQASKGIRIYLSKEERARNLQLVCTYFGIKSSVHLLQREGEVTNFGPRTEDLWYIQITKTDELKTHRLVTDNAEYPKFKGKYQTIRKVETLADNQDVYCFTEHERHMGVFGNVLTYQCNLSEAVIRPTDSEKDIEDKIRIAAILGTWQSTLTNYKYLSKKWRENCEEERLLGVSLTGIMDSTLTNGKKKGLEDRLNKWRELAVATNKEWAEKIGISQSTAVTTGKPSGTVSSLVDSASGIHARHSPYYIRTVRADKKDPLAKMMVDMGFPVEDDVTKPEHNYVFSFPVKAPDHAVFRKDMSAIEQLELWLKYKQNWTEHNQSVTITVREEEWLEVGAWVYKHFDDMTGVSFLPFSDFVYKQAPYQDCTKEEYEELLAKMPKDVDWSKLSEYEKTDHTESTQLLSCTAGGCDLI